MKRGVSINDLNEEYVTAVQQEKKVLAQSHVYAVPNEGYENLKRDNLKPSQDDQTAENEYIGLDRNSMLESFCESQIYSNVN